MIFASLYQTDFPMAQCPAYEEVLARHFLAKSCCGLGSAAVEAARHWGHHHSDLGIFSQSRPVLEVANAGL